MGENDAIDPERPSPARRITIPATLISVKRALISVERALLSVRIPIPATRVSLTPYTPITRVKEQVKETYY